MSLSLDTRQTPNTDVSDGTEFLKAQLINFFTIKENLDRVLPIMNRTSPLSLRMLDHFVVNYSRTTPVGWTLDNGEYFDVQKSYQDRLDKFTKRLFDPFRRNRNSRFYHSFGKERIETTIGQLCFFRWCLQNKILEYVEKNIATINEDMKRKDAKALEEHLRQDMPHNAASPKRRQSRRKSVMQVTATRVPSNGNVKFIVAFD